MFSYTVNHQAQRWLKAPQRIERVVEDRLDEDVQYITWGVLDLLVDEVTVWTGTLRAAHTAEMVGYAHGKVYLRSGLIHPILGGDPSIYGPQDVYPRKPWWTDIAPRIPPMIEARQRETAAVITAAWSLM